MFQLMTKNEPPQTGYSEHGKAHDKFDSAVDTAKKLAKDPKTFGRTVQIESDDGYTVTTITFVPGEVLGVDDDDKVERAPAKFQITRDNRRAKTKVDDDGNIEVGDDQGSIDFQEVAV